MKKRIMKKVVTVVIASLAILSIAACGNGNDVNVNEITFALFSSNPAETQAMDNTIANFTKATGIKVKKEVITDKYMEVMKSRLSAKNAPDVFYVDSFEAPGLIKSNVLEPLTNTIENPEDFYPQFVEAFSGEDKQIYGVPKDYSTLSLYLNLDMLQAAGVDAAQVPTDFKELLNFAKELQPKLPQGTGAMVVEKDLARHLSALEATGATVIQEDGSASFSGNPSVTEYLSDLVKGHKDGYLLSAKEDLGADWAGAAFGTNKAAIMLEGNWVLSALEKDYPDVKFESREMPTVAGKKQTMAFTVGYGVAKNAQNKENAIKFVNYMTNEGQEQWVKEAGLLPTRKSIAEKMQLGTNPKLVSHIKGADYATVWSRGITLPIINTNFGNQFLAAFIGSENVEAALTNIDKVSNEEIRKQS